MSEELANSLANGFASGSKDGAVKSDASDEGPAVAKATVSRLFFVRLPKPAELGSTLTLDKQKDDIDDKLRALTVKLQPCMNERSIVAAKLSESREVARELKAQIEDLELTLNPYQAEKRAAAVDREAQKKAREEQKELNKKQREERVRAEQDARSRVKSEFQGTYGHLRVTSDEEIDARIAELEFRQQHESLPIAEEKAIVKEIQQLQASRKAVREYSLWNAQNKAEQDARKADYMRRKADQAPSSQEEAPSQSNVVVDSEEARYREEMQELKKESDKLWDEYKAQLGVKKQLQDEDEKFKGQIDSLFEERDQLRRARDEVWDKIQKHRDSVRSANKPFSDNRKFSSHVRELIKQGKAAEAQQLCAEQTNELVGQLAKDAGFRKEYNKLWDAAVTYKRPQPVVSDTRSHQTVAASVIAEALETAKRKIAGKSAQPKETEPPSNSSETSKPLPRSDDGDAKSSTIAATKPSVIPGLEVQQRSKAKPKKDKKPKAAQVELPVIDQTEFVPPAVILKNNLKVVSEEERKEQEKEHNRIAAAEAAQRKERRKQAAARKKANRSARADLPPKILAVEEAAEEESGTETPPLEETSPSQSVKLAPDLIIEEGTATVRNRNNNRAAKSGLAPRPRPPARKKGWQAILRQYSRSVYSFVDEQSVAVKAAAAGGAAIGVIGSIWYFTS